MTRTEPKYTVVQHSGFGYSAKDGFEHDLEPRRVTTQREQDAVTRVGGVLFGDWKDADDYCEAESYPGDGVALALHGRAPGTFADLEVDGLRVYVPPPTEHHFVVTIHDCTAEEAERVMEHLVGSADGRGPSGETYRSEWTWRRSP